jgi:hypothetical protein
MKARAITLLSLLRANSSNGQPELDRTTLVKQAFLVENLKPLYDIWSETFSFVRYNYGPYTEEIFYQLDTLIFNGLVEVTKFQKAPGRIEAHYMISTFGVENFERFAPRETISLTQDVVWALQSIGINQATKICKLVYQEPEFVNLLEKDLERGIGPENRTPLATVPEANNRTFQYLTTIVGLSELSKRENGGLAPRELVRVYFELLASNIRS